ncbi:hypothetical protein HOF92_08365 [bacterium]|nr:hypothetical protein [bacterium]
MIPTSKFQIFLVFLSSLYVLHSGCQQDAYGGQCVAYVRKHFGNDRSRMPALSGVSRDLGAYNAWGYWDLGYGYGIIPASNSIFVQARSRYSPLGHMGVVVQSTELKDGRFELIVNDSNWGDDERVDCGRKLTYDARTRLASRGTGNPREILGFIYSGSMNSNLRPVSSEPDFLAGIEGYSTPPAYLPPVSRPDRKNSLFGLDSSSIGIDRLPVYYQSARGYTLDAATRAKILGLKTYSNLKIKGRQGWELLSQKGKSTLGSVSQNSVQFSRRALDNAKVLGTGIGQKAQEFQRDISTRRSSLRREMRADSWKAKAKDFGKKVWERGSNVLQKLKR